MNELEDRLIDCPYCYESIPIIIDCSQPSQEYIEDCQVCCQPILLTININQIDDISVLARRENE